jgi:hypothetical protein
VEIGPDGFIDKLMGFDEYLEKRSAMSMNTASTLVA